MAAVALILRDVVNGHDPAGLADLVADCGLNLELAARLETEFNFIADRARNPAILGHSCYCGEALAGHVAYHLEDCRDLADPPIAATSWA